jgi:hypothetical protein
MTQLTVWRQAAMLDLDNHRPAGVDRRPDLPHAGFAQARTRRTVPHQLPLVEPGETQRAPLTVVAEHREMRGRGAFHLSPRIGLV